MGPSLRTADETVKSSIIRELLKFTTNPEIISFAGGLPAPEVFPGERFRQACEKILATAPTAALQYGASEGYQPLRELIVAQMAKYGIVATVDNVLITTGSQQALDLIAKLLINRGDRILVESTTYLGALQAFDLMGAEYVTVPIDGQDLQTRLLEGALRSGPKFMYVLPNFQNPGGVTLSEERRTQLVWLSDKHGIPIIEMIRTGTCASTSRMRHRRCCVRAFAGFRLQLRTRSSTRRALKRP